MKIYYFYAFWAITAIILYGCKGDNNNHITHNKAPQSQNDNHGECSHHHEFEDNHSHVHTHISNGEHNDIHSDVDVVAFSHKQAENANLKTFEVKEITFSNVIKGSGDVVASPNDAMYIVAPTSGIIVFNPPFPVEGMMFDKGEKIFTISSSNLQEGDVAYRAKLAFENAKSNYERAVELAKDTIISAKELASVKVEYENAKAAYQAVSGNGENGSAVTAPLSGYISQISVNNGDYVNIGQTIAMISKNEKLLLRVDIERQDFAQLPKITSANFILPFEDKVYKLSEMNGRVLSYGRYIIHGENFIPITFEFSNRDNLIPGVFADVFLITDNKEKALVIPESAVCEDEGVYSVFTRIDCEHFRRTEIKLGTRNGEMISVTEGLKEGDIIVSEGVHQLKAAARKSVVPEGHSHSH